MMIRKLNPFDLFPQTNKQKEREKEREREKKKDRRRRLRRRRKRSSLFLPLSMKYVCVEICNKLRREIYNVTRQRTVEEENTFFRRFSKTLNTIFFPLSVLCSLTIFSAKNNSTIYNGQTTREKTTRKRPFGKEEEKEGRRRPRGILSKR